MRACAHGGACACIPCIVGLSIDGTTDFKFRSCPKSLACYHVGASLLNFTGLHACVLEVPARKGGDSLVLMLMKAVAPGGTAADLSDDSDADQQLPHRVKSDQDSAQHQAGTHSASDIIHVYDGLRREQPGECAPQGQQGLAAWARGRLEMQQEARAPHGRIMENVISMAGTDRGEALVAECQRHTQASARAFRAEHASCAAAVAWDQLEGRLGKLCLVCCLLPSCMVKRRHASAAQDEREYDRADTTHQALARTDISVISGV